MMTDGTGSGTGFAGARSGLMGALAALALLGVSAAPAAAQGVKVRLDLTTVQATRPGAARCATTTPSDNAIAAKATSAQRKGYGLAPVKADARLAAAAAAHACDMARRGLMAHQGSTTRGPSQRVKALGYRPQITAENIAAGPFAGNQVLSIWAQSPGHRANILLPQVREMGIGHAVAADGKTVFWAAVYAAPR
ncbi:CAP domain-containing protein [Paracoccus sanguinis]|uniref:CAP domain-containing protein n=1 Tax=Paracoccus sanguinis TaxID=1545044 RepID=UPI001FD3258A|nr:CAP domain-containing protein [Paracoccus sanguinis]